MWLIKLLRALTGLQAYRQDSQDAQGESGQVGLPPIQPTLEDKTESNPELGGLSDEVIQDAGQPTGPLDDDAPGRFLFVDVYPGDVNGKPNWGAFKERELPGVPGFQYIGGVIKCSEGYAWGPQNENWFKKNWRALKDEFPERYGRDWLRGCYCFLRLLGDGKMQADYYLRLVEEAGGGWDDDGTMMPIVDVELGNDGKNGKPRHPNQNATAQQIIDCTSAWAERVRAKTGRRIMLYGNGAMRDKNIKSKMGCDALWIPRYTANLPPITYERAGWDIKEVPAWQWCGDSVGFLKGYPNQTPNFGGVDVSVCIDGRNPVTLNSAKRSLR